MQNWRFIFTLRKPPARAAGVDLNDQGLRWVQLCEDRDGVNAKRLRLERCVFEPLTPGCVVGGQIIDFGEVEAALGRLLAQVQPEPGASPVTALAFAIPDSLVTAQHLLVAARLSEAERLARVRFEMAALLRCDAEDLCVDFRPLQEVGKAGAESALMAAAAPKVAVEDRMALLEAAGLPLQPAVMAVASQAAVRAASRVMQARGVSPQAVVALIQLEPSALRLDLMGQAQVLHSHLFDLASSMSAEAAASSYWLKGVVAQEEDGSAASLEAPLESWDDADVLNVLDLPVGFLQAIEAGRAEQIWVAGTAEQAGAWAATLRQRTTLPCAVLDAFDAMVQPELPASRLIDGPESLVACGLALIALRALPAHRHLGSAHRATDQLSFNFLPHREAAWAQRHSFFYKQLGTVALMVLVVSAAAQHVLSARVQSRQEVLAESAKDIAKVESELKRLASLAADPSSLQRDEAVLLSFMQAPHQMPLLLEELRALLPDGLHLTGVRRDAQGDAVLSGQANSAAEVFALIERLAARSQHFKRPALLDLSLLPALAASQALPAMPALPALPASTPGLADPSGAVTERVVFSLQAYSR